MPFTKHPITLSVISSSEVVDHVRDISAYADRYHSGFAADSSGLDFTVHTGEAYLNGYRVGLSSDGDEVVALANNTVNNVYLKSDGTLQANGAQPANSILLYSPTTSGGAVTTIGDVRDPTVRHNAPLSAEELHSDGLVIGEDIQQSGSQPYLQSIDESGGGNSFRLWNRNGKWQVTDTSGATVYIDDLSELFQGWTSPVRDKDLAAPPGSPATGDRYIVAASGTGAWATHDNKIAEWSGGAWTFQTPIEGWTTWVEDENLLLGYSGAVWASVAGGVSGTEAPTASTIPLRTSTGALRMADPTGTDHGVTLNYLLSNVATFGNTILVKAGSTSAATLATAFENGDTLDGVVLATGDLFLATAQVAGAENGPWIVSATGAPTRPAFFDDSTKANARRGMLFSVQLGTVNAKLVYKHTTTATITLGSTSLTFERADAIDKVNRTGDTMTGSLAHTRAAGTDLANDIRRTGEAAARHTVDADGKHSWGDGTAALDSVLRRGVNANSLPTLLADPRLQVVNGPEIASDVVTLGNIHWLRSAQTVNFTASVNRLYEVNHATAATRLDASLANSPNLGDEIWFVGGANTGFFRIMPTNASHSIKLLSSTSATGTTGTWTAKSIYATIRVRYTATNVWEVVEFTGQWENDAGVIQHPADSTKTMRLGMSIVAKSGAYTVAIGDDGNAHHHTGTYTITLPAMASVFSGFKMVHLNASTGTLTFSSAVTINAKGTKLASQWGACTIWTNGTAWFMVGDLTV